MLSILYFPLWLQRHPTGNLRTRPNTNNKAWIKLSEAILSISRDSWEKCIWSSDPARLLEEFPASKVHLQPATLLTGKFPSRQTDCLYFITMILKAMQLMGSYVHTLLVSWDVAIGQNSALHWEGGRGGGGGQRVFRQIAHSSYSTHQIPSNTLNCLFPGNTFFPRTYYFFKISQPAKIRLKNRRTDIFRDISIGCPCNVHSVISFCFSCFYYNKVNWSLILQCYFCKIASGCIIKKPKLNTK